MFPNSILVASVLFTLIGVGALVAHFVVKYGVNFRRVTYLKAEGVILSTEIVSYQTHETEGEVMSYSPQVRYKFEYQNREYISNHLYRNSETVDSSEMSDAINIISLFQAMDKVTVYFDESNPEKSYLLKNAPIGFIFLIVGVGFIGVGLVLWNVA